MKARTRSISGALMMLVIIPIFAGLLACMPEYVPLGNPERSRVAPEMTGIWWVDSREELIGQVVVLQPWDKRTWLVISIALDTDFHGDLEDDGMSEYDAFIAMLDDPEFDEADLDVAWFVYKGWFAKLGGETFFTWEMRGVPEDKEANLAPWWWYDLHVDQRSGERIEMRLIDPDFPLLKEAPDTPKGWEKVIRKNVDNEAMYFPDTLVFDRVKEDDEGVFSELIQNAMMGEI